MTRQFGFLLGMVSCSVLLLPTAQAQDSKTAPAPAKAPAVKVVAPPVVAVAQPPVAKPDVPQPTNEIHPLAVMDTDKGRIIIELYPDDAPITVENFVTLAKKGFYNGLMFHRVVPNFVIQGGDPSGNGSGGPGYSIKNEANTILKHDRGAVAMANAGRDTAGSQFYIVIGKPQPFLDAKDPDGVNKYTLFGKVIQGQEVAESIYVGDRMKTVAIIEPRLIPAKPFTKAGLEAPVMVEIKIVIEADGTHNEQVTKSCGNPDTDKALLAWVRNWKWEAAKRDGQPVRTEQIERIAIGSVK